jgi:hypothetical protein
LRMGFLLESPVQIVRFSRPTLSTRRGALHSTGKDDPELSSTGATRNALTLAQQSV